MHHEVRDSTTVLDLLVQGDTADMLWDSVDIVEVLHRHDFRAHVVLDELAHKYGFCSKDGINWYGFELRLRFPKPGWHLSLDVSPTFTTEVNGVAPDITAAQAVDGYLAALRAHDASLALDDEVPEGSA